MVSKTALNLSAVSWLLSNADFKEAKAATTRPIPAALNATPSALIDFAKDLKPVTPSLLLLFRFSTCLSTPATLLLSSLKSFRHSV